MFLTQVIFLLSLTCVLSLTNMARYSLRQPFSNENWLNDGSAHYTESFLRLTNSIRSQKGFSYNTLKVNFPYWEVHLGFRVHGESVSLFGDGLAFWYAEKFDYGDAFGMLHKFKGLGVFLDTYNNQNNGAKGNFPLISAMINDGSKIYDHEVDGARHRTLGCNLNFRNSETYNILKIKYYKETLSVSYVDKGKNVECFTESNVFLPTNLYFGVSSATGDLHDNHDIYFIDVYHIEDDVKEDRSNVVPRQGNYVPYNQNIDSSSGYSFFRILINIFLYTLLIIFILVGVAFAYKFYQKRQENRLKRFY